MKTWSFRTKIEIGAILALALGSCSSSPDYFDYEFSDAERDEIADLAADVAHDTVLEHEKVTELEERIIKLESLQGY